MSSFRRCAVVAVVLAYSVVVAHVAFPDRYVDQLARRSRRFRAVRSVVESDVSKYEKMVRVVDPHDRADNDHHEHENGLVFYWRVVVDDDDDGGGMLDARLVCECAASWLGLAFVAKKDARRRRYRRAEAVIGRIRETRLGRRVRKYVVAEGGWPEARRMHKHAQTLAHTDLSSDGTTTTLSFRKRLVETGEIPIERYGDNLLVLVVGTTSDDDRRGETTKVKEHRLLVDLVARAESRTAKRENFPSSMKARTSSSSSIEPKDDRTSENQFANETKREAESSDDGAAKKETRDGDGEHADGGSIVSNAEDVVAWTLISLATVGTLLLLRIQLYGISMLRRDDDVVPLWYKLFGSVENLVLFVMSARVRDWSDVVVERSKSMVRALRSLMGRRPSQKESRVRLTANRQGSSGSVQF